MIFNEKVVTIYQVSSPYSHAKPVRMTKSFELVKLITRNSTSQLWPPPKIGSNDDIEVWRGARRWSCEQRSHQPLIIFRFELSDRIGVQSTNHPTRLPSPKVSPSSIFVCILAVLPGSIRSRSQSRLRPSSCRV